MNITPTNIAIALAVVVTFGLLLWKPLISNLLPISDSTMSTNDDVQAVPSEDLAKAAQPENLSTQISMTDKVVGTGAEAKAGDTISVKYVGTLTDGKVFDKSDAHPDENGGFTFQLGAGQVIKGWDQGFAGMKVGGKRVLVIPPAFGYGAEGTPGGPIPGNATLIFEVELLKVK
jgi:FKBP-type peptidyl-prolyl cis-trans isomerase